MKNISVLIPTINRLPALAITLSSLYSQTYKDFDIYISDQSNSEEIFTTKYLQSVIRVLELHGHDVKIFKNLPKQGIAQQRQFLLEKSLSPYSLFLDDDVMLEPFVIQDMIQAIQQEECGFVGESLIGLSFLRDVRPEEQEIEFWETKVKPEDIQPGSKKWQRYRIHNAANIYHIQTKFRNQRKKYKIAWIGGCVLYNTDKLRTCDGFSFWRNLPKNHVGEDAVAELRVMRKYGGCGLIPSGVYHQELPTTLPDRKFNAPEVLQSVL